MLKYKFIESEHLSDFAHFFGSLLGNFWQLESWCSRILLILELFEESDDLTRIRRIRSNVVVI